jgi:hypothetical protein
MESFGTQCGSLLCQNTILPGTGGKTAGVTNWTGGKTAGATNYGAFVREGFSE